MLPIGTYRMSTGYKVGMFYNGPLTSPFTFSSQISNVQSVSTTSPDGAYPSTIGNDNITSAGYFWFDSPLYGGDIVSNKFIKTGGGNPLEFLKSDGSTDSNNYLVSAGTQIINSLPFLNSDGQLFSDVSNLYVPKGSLIQTAINQITSGQGYSIQLASGAFTENIVLSRENYI